MSEHSAPRRRCRTTTARPVTPVCHRSSVRQRHQAFVPLPRISYLRFVHSTWTDLNWSSRTAVLDTCFSEAGSVHSARADWAPTVLVSLQPIKSWRRRACPMNASCNWVNLLLVGSVQFTCHEEAFTRSPKQPSRASSSWLGLGLLGLGDG